MNGAPHLNLNEVALTPVQAHGGTGEIRFRRVLNAGAFQGPWHFVDYAVLPPGTSIGLHTHGEDEELYLVLEGEGRMQRDGESFRVRAGSVILNPPGGAHGLHNDSERDLKLFVVEVGLDPGASRAEPGSAGDGART